MPDKTNMYSQDREDWLFFVMVWTIFSSILSVIDCSTKLDSVYCFQSIKFKNFANGITERFQWELEFAGLLSLSI